MSWKLLSDTDNRPPIGVEILILGRRTRGMDVTIGHAYINHEEKFMIEESAGGDFQSMFWDYFPSLTEEEK